MAKNLNTVTFKRNGVEYCPFCGRDYEGKQGVSKVREPEKIVCSCGGKVESVKTTYSEEQQLGCGRPGHCVRAFGCNKCKTRFTMKLEAPEA